MSRWSVRRTRWGRSLIILRGTSVSKDLIVEFVLLISCSSEVVVEPHVQTCCLIMTHMPSMGRIWGILGGISLFLKEKWISSPLRHWSVARAWCHWRGLARIYTLRLGTGLLEMVIDNTFHTRCFFFFFNGTRRPVLLCDAEKGFGDATLAYSEPHHNTF